jgi:hypothetical protein
MNDSTSLSGYECRFVRTIMKSKIVLCLALVLSGSVFGGAAVARHSAAPDVKLKLVSVDSEETDGEDGSGHNAVDGDPNTIWHTQWQDKSPGLPHEIIIELIPPSVIEGFTYLPRQDESDHGIIRDYELNVSADGTHFGQPVKKGAFEPGRDKKTETFEPIKCRFIKLKAISEINDLPWTSAAEIGVVQSQKAEVIETLPTEIQPLALSLAIPEHNGERSVDCSSSNSHFHVILSNASDSTRRIWRESCSQGWLTLTFECKDENGESWVASREARVWTRNVPDWWTLKPHESLVMDVSFADPEIWQGFPEPGSIPRIVTMRAIFNCKPDDEARQHSVWAGRVASKPEKIRFCRSPLQNGE